MQMRRQILVGMVAVAALAPAVRRAHAQPTPIQPRDEEGDDALKALYGDRDAAQPPYVRYAVSAAGGSRQFNLDRSQPGSVLLQFEGDSEVWALRSSFGTRGDEFLRNDVGATMLRITSLGGATLYGDGDTAGSPASVEGRGRPIPSLRASHRSLQATVEAALPQVQRLVPGPQLRVEAAGGLSPALVEDAYLMVQLALQRLPRRWFETRPDRLRRIRCARGRRIYASFRNGYLEMGLVPGIGHAGRPSSLAVRNALMGTRGIPN